MATRRKTTKQPHHNPGVGSSTEAIATIPIPNPAPTLALALALAALALALALYKCEFKRWLMMT